METILLWALGIMIGIICAAGGFFARMILKKVEKLEESINGIKEKVNQDLADIKENYKDRFEKASENRATIQKELVGEITEIKESLLVSINELKLEMAKNGIT